MMPTSNFSNHSQEVCWQMVMGLLGCHEVEQCSVVSDDFHGINPPTVTDIKLLTQCH